MADNLERQVRELREIAEETHRLVQKLDSRARWATVGSAIKWLVYAGIILGTFVWLQPYLDAILSGYARIQSLVGPGAGHAATTANPTAFDQLKALLNI